MKDENEYLKSNIFLKIKYELEVFVDENKNQKIAIDESLFAHIEQK